MNRQLLDARSAIEQVLHTYCRAVDNRDTDLLARAVYAPHAVDVRRVDRQYDGIDAILGMFRSSWTTIEATFHQVTNTEINVSDRVARAHSYVVASHWMLADADRGTYRPADCVLVGGYVDAFELLDQGWRIVRRQPFKSGPGGLLSGYLPESFRGFGGDARAPWAD